MYVINDPKHNKALDDVNNSSLKGLCNGWLFHYDNFANYRIYSN